MSHCRAAMRTVPGLLNGRHLRNHPRHLPLVHCLPDHDRASACAACEHGSRFRESGHLAWVSVVGYDGRQLMDVIHAKLCSFAKRYCCYLELLRCRLAVIDLGRAWGYGGMACFSKKSKPNEARLKPCLRLISVKQAFMCANQMQTSCI